MGKILRTDKYWGIFLSISIAASPFTVIGDVANNPTMKFAAMWIMGIAIGASLISIVLRKRLSFPPLVLSNIMQDLFIPYTIGVGTAVFSIKGVPTAVGYWEALGWTLIVILVNLLPSVRKKR